MSEPALGDVRADFRRHLIAWMQIHVRRADWERMTTRPGRALVCKLTGMAVSTYKRCRRWWHAHGYIGTVREGTTPQLERMRRGVLYDLAPARRQPGPRLCPLHPSPVHAPRT